MEIAGFDENYAGNSLNAGAAQGKWNGRTITRENGSLAHLVPKIAPMSGTVGGSVQGNADTDGNSYVGGEVHVTAKDNEGSSISVSAGANIKNNYEGDYKAEGSFKITANMDF